MKNAEEAALQHSLQIAKIVETSVLSEDSWARIAVPWAVYVALQSLKQRRSRRSLQYKVLQKDSTSIFESSLDELVSPYPSAFQPPEPDFLVDALVLDSVNAL
ncbi:hypothetical protein GB937_008954 [Aspergillus fischeri]|nr:hypothetical protein GB937_008954 [Aspergillus fischeri]